MGSDHPRDTPEKMASLVMHKQIASVGVYGVGIHLSSSVPHIVQGITRLVDAEGRTISGAVAIGDTLVGVDGCPTDTASTEIIEQLLSGSLNTTVRLTFRSEKSLSHYDVIVVRHLPIRERRRFPSHFLMMYTWRELCTRMYCIVFM
jgi:hypothetical protein